MTIILYIVKDQATEIPMKVSREQTAQNRERILDAAARLFRERGFDGIGVADLMKEAGLTHGGFYGHFASKEELMAEASARALAGTFALLSKQAERAGDDPLSALASSYLSSRHRDDPGTGCLFATLGPDVSRHGNAIRRTVTDHLRSTIDLLATLVPGKARAARRQKAIGTYATLVGAMVMARAVNDRALSQEILDAGLAAVRS